MPKDTRTLNEVLHAIQNNNYEDVRFIFENRIKRRDKVFPPLSFGCVTESEDKLIKEYENVILAAARLDDTTILKYLLNSGININFVGESPMGKVKAKLSPLHVAVANGLQNTVALLIDANADVNKQDHQGRSPLHIAVKRADCECVRMLLYRGANVALLDKTGSSCLQMASKFGHVELVRMLLEHNAQIFQENQKGPSPLHIAAMEGHVPLIDLFSRYADVNITSRCYDDTEKAALHMAASKGHIETVTFLVDRFGADIQTLDSDQQTALHCVLLQKHDYKRMRRKEDFVMTAEYLIAKGIKPDLQNLNGDTALHFAAKNQFHRITEILLASGMDAAIKNKDGFTAMEVIPDFDLQMKQIFSKYSPLSSPYLKITQIKESCQKPDSPKVEKSLPCFSPSIIQAHAHSQEGIKCVTSGLYQAVFHNVPSEPSAPQVSE